MPGATPDTTPRMRAKSPPIKPKEMELLGLTEVGRLVLWNVDRVVPNTAFRYRRDETAGLTMVTSSLIGSAVRCSPLSGI
jgi:hypothetical protein